MVKVLFVCLGNICRSPTAEGVFRHRVARAGLEDSIVADSAGTADYHLGEPPDSRAQAAARRRGIDLSRMRARQVMAEDFRAFDYVLAMDRDNREALARLCPPDSGRRVGLFLDYAPGLGVREVPDPYYGGPDGFECALDMIEAGADGLLAHLKRTHLS